MTRRKSSREFRIEAVRLVTDGGVAVAQAARDLDEGESVLYCWMRELSGPRKAGFTLRSFSTFSPDAPLVGP